MATKAILLVNLGSPDSYEVQDVKRYLSEFLMDEKVIDIPYLQRLLLVKGIIVPFRSPKSAAKYKSIWTKEGSPLICYTKKLTELVAKETEVPTYMCMRYANPDPDSVIKKIHGEHPDLKELIVLPLYAHYAMSSYETALDHVKNAYIKGSYAFKLSAIPPFYEHPAYINALSESIRPFLKNEYDHLLFSYHGIPERHIKKTDITHGHCLMQADCCNQNSKAHFYCYKHQVKETSRLVAKQLNLPAEKHSFSFQSRLGQDKWLKPYTAGLLKELPAKGIKKLVVVCPSFVSDCLETLEEINIEGRELFMEAGGESFTLVPCLNTNADWVKTISILCNEVN